MKGFRVDKQRFEKTKESFLRSLDNQALESPCKTKKQFYWPHTEETVISVEQCGSELYWLDSQVSYREAEERQVLESRAFVAEFSQVDTCCPDITAEAVQNFFPEILSSMYIEALVRKPEADAYSVRQA